MDIVIYMKINILNRLFCYFEQIVYTNNKTNKQKNCIAARSPKHKCV